MTGNIKKNYFIKGLSPDFFKGTANKPVKRAELIRIQAMENPEWENILVSGYIGRSLVCSLYLCQIPDELVSLFAVFKLQFCMDNSLPMY